MFRRPENLWVTATYCITSIMGIFSLWFYFMAFQMARELPTGWDGLKIGPFAVLDYVVLLVCSVGVFMRRTGFALALVVLQAFTVFRHFISLISTSDLVMPRALVPSILFLLLFYRCFRVLQDENEDFRLLR